jgi:uncharacterized damage-inducible protein DinB
MSSSMPDKFIEVWNEEARRTVEVLRALPLTKYDFRPDAGGRSLGELAWHLAEVDGYISLLIEKGTLDAGDKPPNIERPRSIEALAPAYERVHREAVARIRPLKPEDMQRRVPFFDGRPIAIEDLLWGAIVDHMIHHRGQLVLMCRLAGGSPPGLYGPTREQTAVARESRG